MLTNSVKRGEVNVFMGIGNGELPEYATISLDRYNLTVQVEYYCAESYDMDIDLDKLELIKRFQFANLEEAERKYSELNDVRKVYSMVSKYLKNKHN